MDKSEAGTADLDVQLVAPSGVVTPLEVKGGPSGETVEWVPDAPGQYRITILYGGEEVSCREELHFSSFPILYPDYIVQQF